MKDKTLWILGGLGLIAFLIWILSRSKTQSGQQVSSKILSFSVTQLGAPVSAIETLSYDQLQNDVQFWIDPGTGKTIPNTPGLLNGKVPLVALTDQIQVSNWFQQNPQAVADMNNSAFVNS